MKWLLLVLALLVAFSVAVFWLLTPPDLDRGHPFLCLDCLPWRRHANPVRRPPGDLKSILAAQFHFRDHRLNDSITQTFWKKDIAGLYTRFPPDQAHNDGSTNLPEQAIKLIEQGVAAADSEPDSNSNILNYVERQSRHGYWFKSIPHADEKIPDSQRFAACAFPDQRSDEKYLYVIDQRNIVYRRLVDQPGGITVFPTDDELRKSWTKVK